ncbi:MAG: hypothetical protein AAF390_16790 [Pseudomonadota bacterium]
MSLLLGPLGHANVETVALPDVPLERCVAPAAGQEGPGAECLLGLLVVVTSVA